MDWQTRGAGLVLPKAAYSLTPYRLHSAPGVLLGDANFSNTRPGCWVACCQLWLFEPLQKGKKQDLQEDIYNLSLFPREGGPFPEALACCISLLPGKNTKAIFYFLQTRSPCFSLASVDREPNFWPHASLPPPALLGNHRSALYGSESVSVLWNSSFVSWCGFHMEVTLHPVYFSLWLTSLRMVIARSIHVAANGIISFFMAGVLLYVNTASLFTHPSDI